MKKIGIKLADGTFFPILEDGSPEKKEINLTTVKDNQTKVKVDLYRGEKSSIDEAEYLDTLEISKMKKHPNGEPNIGLAISLDEKNELSAKIVDKESGAQSQVSISLLSEIKNGKKSGDAENSDEAEGVTLASSPAQENVLGEAENAPVEEVASDVDLPAEETVQEIPAEENESAPTETTEENFADGLPSLDEMDFSLPETSEQDGGAPTVALQDDDFSLDETISAEPPQSSDEPQSSLIDENFSEEVAPDMDVPAQEIPAEETESAPVETAQDNFADDLPSLDEMNFSLPEISEQDGGASTEAALQDDDFSLDETVSAEPPQSNDEPQPSPIDETVLEETAPDVDVPAEETVQDSALPDLDFPDISFDESDFSGTKNETQNESDSASDDLDFSDMDFELPDFDDMNFSSDGTSSNSDGEKKSSAHNSDSFSEHNASSTDALDFSDLYDDENDYGEQSQEKNQRFPLLVCIVCAIICVLALLGILFIAPMRFNSFSENQSQDSAQELPSDFPDERISSELPPPPERPVEPIAPPAKEDEIVVITETKNVVPDFPPPQEKKSEPKEIIYKIKWGDTLWDLSAAYYKNPWLYPKIARYNNIKNPDYIIAGNTIRIPEE